MIEKEAGIAQVLTIVFSVAFGLIALAVSYAAVFRPTENRSRAAQAKEKAYKAWEFNGTDPNGRPAEGWTVSNLSTPVATDGVLRATFTNEIRSKASLASFKQTSVATTLPSGAKSVQMRLGIGAASPKKAPYSVTGTLTYTLAGKTTKSKPLTFTVPADGTLQEYRLTLPEIAQVTVSGLEIAFTGYTVGSKLSIDLIRLTGAVPSPTPYPTKRPTPTFYPKMTPTPSSYFKPTPTSTGDPRQTPTSTPFPTSTQPPTPPPAF